MKNHNPKCKCGGPHYKEKDGHKIDADNVLGLDNPWNKKATPEDLKLCKECWFEKRNGHAQNCSQRLALS